jgi:LysM repeat protein
MNTKVRAGDTLIRIAAREGITLAALQKANPGVDPRALRVGQQLKVPGDRDEFVGGKRDASAQRALRQLEATGGPTISASELRRAIDRGTGDHDANMAGSEFREFKRWAGAHADQLTDGAKQVMALYEKSAERAQDSGRTGLSDEARTRLLHRMALVNGGGSGPPPVVDPPPPPPKTGEGKPDTAKEWQREAMKHPAQIFKRQVADGRWNRDPDAPSHSGHCAITSLAMAVEAYGLERKGLNQPRHVRDQDSIDDVARKMPDKFMVQKNGGHTWYSRTSEGAKPGTYAYQMAAAAKRTGLEEKQHSGMSMREIDRALEKGHMVCLAGEAGDKFRRAQGHGYADGHSVLVMGKTPDGKYLVCDPLSKKGPTELTREQLASYDTSGYTSTEVWRAKE